MPFNRGKTECDVRAFCDGNAVAAKTAKLFLAKRGVICDYDLAHSVSQT